MNNAEKVLAKLSRIYEQDYILKKVLIFLWSSDLWQHNIASACHTRNTDAVCQEVLDVRSV